MRVKHLVYASMIASAPFFAGCGSSEMVSAGSISNGSTSTGSALAEPTLWGIYGAHNVHDCPVNNRETAKFVIAASLMDLGPLMEKYGVTAIVDQYHSGLEHTFLWAVETTEPHQLVEFCIELGIARWNDLKFVPLRTFKEGVVPAVRALHGLEDWEPGHR